MSWPELGLMTDALEGQRWAVAGCGWVSRALADRRPALGLNPVSLPLHGREPPSSIAAAATAATTC